MNARERFLSVMRFEPVDRTLMWEFGYWSGAVRRWYEEGLPQRKGVPDWLPSGRSMQAEASALDPEIDAASGRFIAERRDEDVHATSGEPGAAHGRTRPRPRRPGQILALAKNRVENLSTIFLRANVLRKQAMRGQMSGRPRLP